MSDLLAQAGYSVDDSDGVWRRPTFESIPYSDGDEFEQRIEKVLLDAQDRSLFSPQLAAACVDWPSYYHLNPTRANILRPLGERLQGADVLEVGAGCGAVTRYLGELGANVCALEGSRRRSRIARLRTTDLTNVSVVAENFETFAGIQKFDVITFIGVLEYANQFVGGEVPAATMLTRARSMLKPGGVVVIAIENQLGLKYFAGAPEDHVGRRMFGIEDSYSTSGVRTYGRAELAALLAGSGFSQQCFYAPFPDYKFPVTIFSEEGMVSSDIDAHSMLQTSIHSDRQLTQFLSFDLSKAWSVVIRNKLGMDLANSFLVVASERELSKQPILAWHYSTGRAPHFCKQISFEQRGNTVYLLPRLIDPSLKNPVSASITIKLPQEVPFVHGTQLSGEFVSLLTTDGWSIQDVASLTKRFLTIAESLVRAEGVDVNLLSPEATIPGKYLDLIPQNIIKTGTGEFVLIDREWEYQTPVSSSWLVFRAFCGIFAAFPVFGASVSDFKGTRLGFMTALFNALGFEVTEEKIFELGRTEAHLQSLVRGISIDEDFWGPKVPISRASEGDAAPIFNFGELVHGYEAMQHQLNEIKSHVEAIKSQMTGQAARVEKELPDLSANLVSELRILNAERDLYQRTLKGIEDSVSWRMTAPLRALKTRLLTR